MRGPRRRIGENQNVCSPLANSIPLMGALVQGRDGGHPDRVYACKGGDRLQRQLRGGEPYSERVSGDRAVGRVKGEDGAEALRVARDVCYCAARQRRACGCDHWWSTRWKPASECGDDRLLPT